MGLGVVERGHQGDSVGVVGAGLNAERTLARSVGAHRRIDHLANAVMEVKPLQAGDGQNDGVVGVA